MPTNRERREVAAMLRELAEHGAPELATTACCIAECIGERGYPLLSGRGTLFARLADLIEPEERTCHMRVLENARGNPKHFLMYVCSECHGAVVHDRYDPIYYCPNCGAKVVEE